MTGSPGSRRLMHAIEATNDRSFVCRRAGGVDRAAVAPQRCPRQVCEIFFELHSIEPASQACGIRFHGIGTPRPRRPVMNADPFPFPFRNHFIPTTRFGWGVSTTR